MPAKKQDKVGRYFELPPDLFDALDALAERNRRYTRDELEHAVRRHLAQPPVVEVIEESLEPAQVAIEAGKAAPKKRGPRKKGGGK